MPHDKNGSLLQVGDVVTLRCRITAVHEGETACNVTAEAIERPEGEDYIPTIAGNSRFYEKHHCEPAHDSIQREMPRYRCHKEINALKIKEVIKHAHPDPNYSDSDFEASTEFQGAHLFPCEPGFAPIPIDADWYRKHKPEAGGYYVVYDDGYKSYSPAKAFEQGYTRK